MIIQLYKPELTSKGLWSWETPFYPTRYLPLTYTRQECIDHICDELGVIIRREEYFDHWVSLRVGGL